MFRFDEIRLEPAEYRLLRELFNQHCGLTFGPEAKSIVERRLRERLAALGLSSFGEYYQLLRFDERGRNELDETQELYYPPICQAIAATDYNGYVGQEFSPKNGADWAKSLEAAHKVCDV